MRAFCVMLTLMNNMSCKFFEGGGLFEKSSGWVLSGSSESDSCRHSDCRMTCVHTRVYKGIAGKISMEIVVNKL